MSDSKDDDMAVVGKEEEEARDGTPSSIESTPEQEAEADASEQPAQPQKRKGGRKPVSHLPLHCLPMFSRCGD